MNRTAAIRVDALAMAACAALTALVYFSTVRPTLGSQAKATENYQQYQARSVQSDDLARRVGELDKSVAELRRRLATSNVKLRKITEINSALDELANLARQHHVEIDQVSSGDALQGAVLAMAPVKLTAMGAFPDVVEFLNQLESSHPEIAAVKFSIEAVRDSGHTPGQRADTAASRAKLTMNLEWYAEPAVSSARTPAAKTGTAPR